MQTSYAADDYTTIARRLKEITAERHKAEAKALRPLERSATTSSNEPGAFVICPPRDAVVGRPRRHQPS